MSRFNIVAAKTLVNLLRLLGKLQVIDINNRQEFNSVREIDQYVDRIS